MRGAACTGRTRCSPTGSAPAGTRTGGAQPVRMAGAQSADQRALKWCGGALDTTPPGSTDSRAAVRNQCGCRHPLKKVHVQRASGVARRPVPRCVRIVCHVLVCLWVGGWRALSCSYYRPGGAAPVQRVGALQEASRRDRARVAFTIVLFNDPYQLSFFNDP